MEQRSLYRAGFVWFVLVVGCAHGARGTAQHPHWQDAKTKAVGFQPVKSDAEAQRYLRYAVRLRDVDMRSLSAAQPRLVGYLQTGRVTAEQVAQLGGSHYRVLEEREGASSPWLNVAASRGCPLMMRQPSSAAPLTTGMPLATLVDPTGQSPCAYGESSRLPPRRAGHPTVVEVWLVAPERLADLPEVLQPRPRSYL